MSGRAGFHVGTKYREGLLMGQLSFSWPGSWFCRYSVGTAIRNFNVNVNVLGIIGLHVKMFLPSQTFSIPCIQYPQTAAAFSKAFSKSIIISSKSSYPTDTRTDAGPTPAAICSSGLSCWCVVDAG